MGPPAKKFGALALAPHGLPSSSTPLTPRMVQTLEAELWRGPLQSMSGNKANSASLGEQLASSHHCPLWCKEKLMPSLTSLREAKNTFVSFRELSWGTFVHFRERDKTLS